jgi:Zn-dependent M28 family amino/carboxypeptidase
MMRVFFFIVISVTLFISCKKTSDQEGSALSEATFRRHLATLASDEFLGRKPFTPGEEKTVNYLETEVKAIGLQPGNGSSYFQDVPLVEITGHPSDSMMLAGPQSIPLALSKDYVLWTERTDSIMKIESSDLVFCGYGIVAPEYNWNDYAGLDMKGKTALVLVNDPGLGGEDSTFFKGSTMTYYGRWTYKYEEAARQGADAILIIHETNMAGYPWAVVQGAGSGSKLNLETAGHEPVGAQGWVSLDAAKMIFDKAGVDLSATLKAARQPGFKAMPLPYKVNVEIENTVRRNTSKNVIAMIPGSSKPDEYIIFSAHWDHLGVGTPVDGDSIYNGAIDNATGTASLLTIAEEMVKGGPYQRSIVFLWVTAEEQGLLGSAYYAAHPIFPPEQTVANLNIDAMYAMGRMKDLSVIGFGQSELEDYARQEAEKQGRYLQPDPEAEKGYFFRSDHFNFAKIGIPALYAEGAGDHWDNGKSYAKTQSDEYRTLRYHQPADEYDESMDVSGMIQDTELYLNIAKALANSDHWPAWRENSEFKALRKR